MKNSALLNCVNEVLLLKIQIWSSSCTLFSEIVVWKEKRLEKPHFCSPEWVDICFLCEYVTFILCNEIVDRNFVFSNLGHDLVWFWKRNSRIIWSCSNKEWFSDFWSIFEWWDFQQEFSRFWITFVSVLLSSQISTILNVLLLVSHSSICLSFFKIWM